MPNSNTRWSRPAVSAAAYESAHAVRGAGARSTHTIQDLDRKHAVAADQRGRDHCSQRQRGKRDQHHQPESVPLGRTSDLLTAIEAHKSSGSEANTVVQQFNALSEGQQQDVLNFLRSL